MDIYAKGVIIVTFLLIFLAFSSMYKWNIYDSYIKMPAIKMSDLKTGDIVLTRCNHQFPIFYAVKNVLYSAITGVPHTHVGIIYKSKSNGPYIIHYMINHQAECILHNNEIGYSGLNMAKLDEFLARYHGNVTIRRIGHNNNYLDPCVDDKKFMDFIMEKKDEPFHNSPLSLINSAFKFIKTWSDKYFCSNFVTSLLKHIDVISNEYNNITPADFSMIRDYKHHLKYKNGYSYSDEHLLMGFPMNYLFY